MTEREKNLNNIISETTIKLINENLKIIKDTKKELRDLNFNYGSHERSTIPMLNLKALIGTKKECRAFILYDRIQQAKGRLEILDQLKKGV